MSAGWELRAARHNDPLHWAVESCSNSRSYAPTCPPFSYCYLFIPDKCDDMFCNEGEETSSLHAVKILTFTETVKCPTIQTAAVLILCLLKAVVSQEVLDTMSHPHMRLGCFSVLNIFHSIY